VAAVGEARFGAEAEAGRHGLGVRHVRHGALPPHHVVAPPKLLTRSCEPHASAHGTRPQQKGTRAANEDSAQVAKEERDTRD
jgi:hypothetical protein